MLFVPQMDDVYVAFATRYSVPISCVRCDGVLPPKTWGVSWLALDPGVDITVLHQLLLWGKWRHACRIRLCTGTPTCAKSAAHTVGPEDVGLASIHR